IEKLTRLNDEARRELLQRGIRERDELQKEKSRLDEIRISANNIWKEYQNKLHDLEFQKQSLAITELALGRMTLEVLAGSKDGVGADRRLEKIRKGIVSRFQEETSMIQEGRKHLQAGAAQFERQIRELAHRENELVVRAGDLAVAQAGIDQKRDEIAHEKLMDLGSIKRVRDILVRGHRSKGDAKDASKLADLTAGLITAYKKLYDHEDDEEILTVCLVDALGGLRIHLPELHSSLRQCTEEDIMAVLAYMQARHLQEEPGPLLIGINPECSVYMSVILPAREPLVCQGCGMHYRCRVNASRCLSSHVSDADAARKPLYSRQELEQHWEGLDADARKCIMGACGLPMPWRVETIGAEELLDDAMRKSEFTYLFRVTTSPALFDFEYDDTIYTIWNMNATGADRLMHALVASYETHKQHVADELLRDTSNKKKKQKKKLTAEMVKGDEILAKKYEEQKEKK
ncbi:hypothetical protein EBT31_19255, partial [bacterium]|nr:hypothetical protein [bacterium]